MARVVVAGAGPAGSAAAMGLRREGIETILVDRRPFPRTKVCGSGLSPWTLDLLDELGVGAKVRSRAFRIDGAIIAGVEGDGIELRGDHETAILLREEFDELLMNEARARGAEFREGVRVRGAVYDGERLVGVETADGVIEADGLIDCTGATGKLASTHHRSGRTLHTILGWFEGVANTQDVVELYFDPTVKPHYGWVFPETAERVNIGLVYEPTEDGLNARERFSAFVERRLSRRIRGAQQLGKLMGHPAHVSSFPRGLVRDGVLVAGEAGRLVDAATAEGIYHGLVSGTAAGRLLGQLLGEGEAPTAAKLAPYQRIVQQKLAVRMMLGRSLMTALRSPVLDLALRLGDSRPVRTVITKAFAGLYHG
ncbi:MAG: NAD(P)/FAD-dependent oxidoreductase [Myxococcota bacterium]